MAARKKKEITLDKGGFKTVWRTGEKGSRLVEVDVYKDDKLVLEWQYGMVVGNSLMGNASFWLEQVILQAQSPT